MMLNYRAGPGPLFFLCWLWSARSYDAKLPGRAGKEEGFIPLEGKRKKRGV